jgi:hypothetical protein
MSAVVICGTGFGKFRWNWNGRGGNCPGFAASLS